MFKNSENNNILLTSLMSTMWKTPDVHQWSREMSALVTAEFPDLPQTSQARANMFDMCAQEVIQKYSGNQELAQVVSKLKARSGINDHDLCQTSVVGLFVIVWQDLVKKIDSDETYSHFLFTLMDMGQTCVQGDTHRLFSTYVALKRSL